MIQNNRMKNFFFRTLCGFFLGVSIVAPGVSGSVMAVMMGIYRDLINIISNPFRRFKRNVFYLLPMGIGALISLALCVKAFAWLFDTYPIQARLLFMGLIAGGLKAIFQQANSGPFKRHYLIGILAAFGVAVTVGLIARGQSEPAAATASVIHLWYLCIAGGIAGMCSMVPGMSVSMILMLLGVYDYLLQVASELTSSFWHTVSIAIPVGLCFLVGMVLFSRLTKFVFERYPYLAYFMVFGFMCGTLTAIFPDAAPASALGWVGCVLMLIAGLFVSALFQFLGKKFNVEEAEEEAEKKRRAQKAAQA